MEPTETEHKEMLDSFVEVVRSVQKEAGKEPELVKSAPHCLPVRRLGNVSATPDLDFAWKPANG